MLGCPSSRDPGTSHRRSAQRVVSLTPNTTETVFALDAGHRLVGRSRHCDYPIQATSIPTVGGYVDPSLETILGLRPDLVVGARGPIGRSMVDKLEARGTECFFPPTESVSEIFAMIQGLAERLNTKSEGARLLQSIQDRLRHIKELVANKPSPRTLLVFGQTPISVAGPESFPSEMLALAGCTNAVDSGTRYPILGIETLIVLDPDLIIDATMAGSANTEPIGPGRAGWASIRAVREGHVVRLDNDTILRPGPRLAEGVALLAHHTHDGLQLP